MLHALWRAQRGEIIVQHDAPMTDHCLIVQLDEWRVRRAGSLKICSSQLEFAGSLLGGSSKGRIAEIQSLRKIARSVSELLRSGMPLVSAENLHQVLRHLQLPSL